MTLPCILLTGASGVVGRAILPNLLSNYKVIAVGTQISNFSEEVRYHKNFKFYERDFTKLQSANDFEIAEDPKIILHLAGVVSGTKASEEIYYSVNARSVQLISEYAKMKKTKAVLFLSSVSVYGFPSITITETTLPMGNSLYAISKLAGEKEFLASGAPGSIFRIASLFGPGTKSAIAKLESLFLRGFFILPSPDIKRPYLAINDLVKAIEVWIQKVENGQKIERLYLLSDLEMMSFQTIFAAFQKRFPQKTVFALPLPLALIRWLFQTLKFFFPKWGSSPTFLVSLSVDSSASWKKLGIEPQSSLAKAYDPPQ